MSLPASLPDSDWPPPGVALLSRVVCPLTGPAAAHGVHAGIPGVFGEQGSSGRSG